MQTEKCFDELQNKASEFRDKFVSASKELDTKRVTRPSKLLSDFVVTETLGQRDSNRIKNAYFEVLHVMSTEMDRRFTENSEILLALSSIDELNFESIKPLTALNLTLPCESEVITAKNFLTSKKKEQSTEKISEISLLEPVKDAFPAVYNLFTAIETFACSTAVNEAAFSCLARIDIVKRMSMTSKRLCDLSLIAFQKETLDKISDETILAKFKTENGRITL